MHFRRPTLLSTIQIANTQPFLTAAEDLAFCHNGLFTEAESYRPAYADRLAGAADSEVGFCMLQDLVGSGTAICDALAIVHAKLGGNANLATLDSRGVLALFSKHERNQFWTFRTGDADVAATELHSPDGSLFNLIFPGATDRAVVDESAQSCEQTVTTQPVQPASAAQPAEPDLTGAAGRGPGAAAAPAAGRAGRQPAAHGHPAV